MISKNILAPIISVKSSDGALAISKVKNTNKNLDRNRKPTLRLDIIMSLFVLYRHGGIVCLT
jgi:hypothetical protein